MNQREYFANGFLIHSFTPIYMNNESDSLYNHIINYISMYYTMIHNMIHEYS